MASSRKQRRLLERARRLESLRRTYGDYGDLLRERQAAAAAAPAADRRAAARRFDALGPDERLGAVVRARLAAEDAAYGALLRDAALVGRALSDGELAALRDAHERRRAAILARAASGQGAAEGAGRAAEGAGRGAEDPRRGASRGLERRRDRCEKRAAALAGRLEATEAALRALGAGADAAPLEEGVALRVSGLRMHFGGVKAVDDLSFDVREGEIFGLIGPNGAGKTTVFNCITQFYKPTAGALLFRAGAGRVVDLTRERVHDVILHGIVRTFQNVEVVPELSVLENLMVAGHRQFTSGLAACALRLPRMRMENEVVRARAERVLAFMGLSAYGELYAFGLPYGVLKKIEIARTLMCAPRLVILDEPAAGLNDTETAELARLIRRIRDEFGCTVLLVEHDMGLVMDVCDSICAIAFGKRLACGTPAEIQADREVQRAYLGVDEEAM